MKWNKGKQGIGKKEGQKKCEEANNSIRFIWFECSKNVIAAAAAINADIQFIR